MSFVVLLLAFLAAVIWYFHVLCEAEPWEQDPR
jgi:hypothetical protein